MRRGTATERALPAQRVGQGPAARVWPVIALPALVYGLALACAFAGCLRAACSGTQCADASAASRSADAGDRVVEANSACASQAVRAMRGPPKPVDVIFVIDNSGSMSEEIAGVRENINKNFAQLIEQSGVDYRVLMLSLYGTTENSVCIQPPLAATDCAAGLRRTNSPVFFHYSQEIGSTDAFCQILSTFDRPDSAGQAPQGWQAWLRKDAQKAFVVITDDSADCNYEASDGTYSFGGDRKDPYEDALSFHQALLARSPEQFGVPPNVKYQFFSIVGMARKALPAAPTFPYEPLENGACETAPSPGLSYQALSVATDALRYPVCEGRSFDALFRVLASSVIAASKADCVFELPAAPDGQELDIASINLEYRPGDGSAARRFRQVAAATSCKDDRSFFVGDRIELCPAACRKVQEDKGPEIGILFGCSRVPD